jgi:uncharacterized RDD family membrane protein YckC
VSGVAEAQARGQALGLPAVGPGSLARFGPRLLALLVDCLLADGVAALLHNMWLNTPVLAAEMILMIAVGGQTVGMLLLRLRVVRLNGRRVGLLWAFVRTLLLFTVFAALFTDHDRRGLHDRAAGTAIVSVG